MQLALVTLPATEPVTLVEAKLYTKVDTSADDDLLTSLITAARQYAEQYTLRAFINQTWQLTLDYDEFCLDSRFINLPRGNIQSITSFTYYNTDNTSAVFANTNYRLSDNRLVLNDSADWPVFSRLYNAVTIEYVAGYGTAADKVPRSIKQAMLMLIDHYYINRNAATSSVNQMPFGVTALLQPFRLFAL